MVRDLVTLEAAKTQLRIRSDNTDHDADIATKIIQASAIVMQHHKLDTVPSEWIINASPETLEVPGNIQAATLLVLSELFENREAGISNPLSDAVKSLIPRMPTLG